MIIFFEVSLSRRGEILSYMEKKNSRIPIKWNSSIPDGCPDYALTRSGSVFSGLSKDHKGNHVFILHGDFMEVDPLGGIMFSGEEKNFPWFRLSFGIRKEEIWK